MSSERHDLLLEEERVDTWQSVKQWFTRKRLIGIAVGIIIFVVTVTIIVVAVKHEKSKSGNSTEGPTTHAENPTVTDPVSPTVTIPEKTTTSGSENPTVTYSGISVTTSSGDSTSTGSDSSASVSSRSPPATTSESQRSTSESQRSTSDPQRSTSESQRSTSNIPTTISSTIPPTTGSQSSTITSTVIQTTVIPTISPKDFDKLECVASLGDKNECEKAGCIWEPTQVPDVPSCILPTEDKFGYKLETYNVDTESALLTVHKPSFFGDEFKKVRVTVTDINENVVRIQFLDEENERYQVPVKLNSQSSNPPVEKKVYQVEISSDPDELFAFKVIRKEDSTVIFDSSVSSLFLAEHHIEVTTKLPSRNLYGIGESTHKVFRHDLNSFNKWPLFARDQPPNPWDGAGRYNLYGVHPYYMCLEDSGKSHGVLFLNSNAMEFTTTPMPALNFRSSGGVLDMFFFLGESPEHLTQIYTNIIGRPMIPPYWAIGFQLSHYGYNTLDNMRATINRTRDKGFPLDVVHADIDLMDGNKDFTWDTKRFPKYNEFVDAEKKENGLRFIIILDPALLANDSNYQQYINGLDADVYIKWPSYIPLEQRNNPPNPGVNLTQDIMFGRVWPNGPVAFPDFFKNSTEAWWEKTISDYRQRLDFDALWIDMNEPASFGTDQKEPWFCPTTDKTCWALKCPLNRYDHPNNTFIPAATTVYSPPVNLSDKTICMAAVQGENGEYVHYDVHNLYGWSETESTYRALKLTGKADQVPLVISRSTYPSSGRHAGHWLGDNYSSWNSMRSSIVGMLEFNLFGIPYIGADICGFLYNTTSELCGRWMQLGAFYPFCRNHNSMGNIDQDPGSDLLTDRDRERALVAMKTRYQLLPYLHTLHYFAHAKGNTVVRALFHEFPTDAKTYGNQDQFMWGQSLLISPSLYSNMTSLSVYLPDDLWYDFYDGTLVQNTGRDRIINVTNLEIVSLHVRAGSVLPLKLPDANSTKDSREKDFEIRVYPKDSSASGYLYWMAQEATDIDNPEFFRLYKFQLKQGALIIKLESDKDFAQPNNQTIEKIVVYDQDKMPVNVKYQGMDLDKGDYSYESKTKALTINYKVDLEELHPETEPERARKFEWS